MLYISAVGKYYSSNKLNKQYSIIHNNMLYYSWQLFTRKMFELPIYTCKALICTCSYIDYI